MDLLFCIFIVLLAIVLTFVFGFRIKNVWKRTLVIALVLLGLSLISNESIYWFIYFDGPYYGRVVDAETGAPLEGAAVAGIWQFEHLYFQSVFTFANATEATTDKDGKFKLPLTFAFTRYPISVLWKMELLVFKPGYDSHPPAIERGIKPEWADYESKSGMYWVGRRANCVARQECLVELNKTESIEEEKVVYRSVGLGDIPIESRKKIENFINMLNRERERFGADKISIYRDNLKLY